MEKAGASLDETEDEGKLKKQKRTRSGVKCQRRRKAVPSWMDQRREGVLKFTTRVKVVRLQLVSCYFYGTVFCSPGCGSAQYFFGIV